MIYRLFIAIITSLMITLIVLTIQPKLHKQVQFISANFGYRNMISMQDIQNHVTKTTNHQIVEDKSSTKELINRDAYMKKLREKAQPQFVDNIINETNTSHKETATKNNKEKVRELVKREAEINKSTSKATTTATSLETVDSANWSCWRNSISNEITKRAAKYYKSTESNGVIYDISFDVSKNKYISNVNVHMYYKPLDAHAESGYNALRKATEEINGTDRLTFPCKTNKTTQRFTYRTTPSEWNAYKSTIYCNACGYSRK